MKRILVPTDFSANANKALVYAAEIAKAAGAEIFLIHVCDLADIPFRHKTVAELKYNLPYEDACLTELASLKANIRDTMQLAVTTRLYAGPVAASIIGAVEENKIDLVIMGTIGEAAFKEKLFGSVSAAVMGKTRIPVLVVPLLAEWDIPKHILLLVNHFEEPPAKAGPAFEIANLFGSKVSVAVFTDEDSAVAVDYLENTRSVTAYEEKLRSVYKDTWVEPEKLYGHTFQETLDEYVSEHYIDILVMFIHHRNFIESIFNRSMTKKMSYQTNIPLLAIPAQSTL